MVGSPFEDDKALRSLEVKHWRFWGHITTVEAELDLALVRPSFQERLMEQTEDEAITDISVREAKLFGRLREHDKVCRGCEKPSEGTEEGIRAALEAMASCM